MFFPVLVFTLLHFSIAENVIICDAVKVIKVKSNSDIKNGKKAKKRCKLKKLKDCTLAFIITTGYLKHAILSYSDNKSTELKATQLPFIKDYNLQISNTTNFTLLFTNTSVTSWNGFQGYVTYEKSSKCPFTTNPFFIKNETQVIYIRTPYSNNLKKEVLCNWNFRGPKGYGFKFYVIHQYDSKINISVTNSSNYDILKGYGLKKRKVYYNSDNFLTINILTNQLFEAHVSIIKNKWEVVSAGCTRRYNGLTEIWSNLGESAYPNNAECNMSIEIPPNTFLAASPLKIRIEQHVDSINFIDTNNEIHDASGWQHTMLETSNSFYEHYATYAFYYNPNNDDNNTVKGLFHSDGSIQNEGFEIAFDIIECQCAEEIITVPCEEELELPITLDGYNLCPNMTCNFVVSVDSSCATKNLIFEVLLTEFPGNIGFEITADDGIYFDFQDYEVSYATEALTILFMPKQINTIRFFRLTDSFFGLSESAYFTLKAVEESTIQSTVILSKENPIFKIDFLVAEVNSFFFIELSDERMKSGDTFEVSLSNVYDLFGFLLYEDKTLKTIIPSMEKLEEILKNATTIAIYITEKIDFRLVLRVKNAHNENCVFTNNVGLLSGENFITTAMAKSSGYCELILHSEKNGYYIDDIWTNSEENIITKYISPNNTVFVTHFNKTTSTYWQKIKTFASFTTFSLPPNSSIIIWTTDSNTIDYITFKNEKILSFFETPNFGSFETYTDDYYIDLYNILNQTIMFQVQYFDISPEGWLHITDGNNKQHDLKAVGDKAIFQDAILYVGYYEPNEGYMGARIGIYSVNESD